MAYDIAVLVGSLRRDSLTRKSVRALQRIAPPGLRLDIVELGQLPLYNADFETNPPAAVRAFRQRIAAADAVLFATPEYNRSVPGVLKNAIDIGSRPYAKSVWQGKPAAVISVSPGALGAFGANHHLRQSLVYLDMPAMPQPEVYIGNVESLFSEDGGFEKPETREFLGKFLKNFEFWISRHRPTRRAAA
jgi:chromate reductase